MTADSKEHAGAAEKLKKYEKDYSDFMALMVNMKSQARQVVNEAKSSAEQILKAAKKDAEGTAAAAQSQAEQIVSQAKEEGRSLRENVERELEKRKEEETMKFQTASFRLANYLEALNRSQSRLLKAYEEMGHLVKLLPIKNGGCIFRKAL